MHRKRARIHENREQRKKINLSRANSGKVRSSAYTYHHLFVSFQQRNERSDFFCLLVLGFLFVLFFVFALYSEVLGELFT